MKDVSKVREKGERGKLLREEGKALRKEEEGVGGKGESRRCPSGGE